MHLCECLLFETLDSRRLFAFAVSGYFDFAEQPSNDNTAATDTSFETQFDGFGNPLRFEKLGLVKLTLDNAAYRYRVVATSTYVNALTNGFSDPEAQEVALYQSDAGGATLPYGQTGTLLNLDTDDPLELFPGVYFFRYRVAQRVDDSDTDVSFSVSVTELTAPEVNVVSVTDGDSTASAGEGTDFGSAESGSAAVQRTFTVQNTGGSTLNLGSVSVPTGFAVVKGLPATLASGGSMTFIVAMSTASVGAKSGQVSFSTSDSNENPYNFAIGGTVTPVVGVSTPTFVKQGTMLVITGTEGRDILGVNFNNGVLRAGVRGTDPVAFAGITSILMDGNGGSDRLALESNVLLPATLIGDAGKDVLLGGSGNDSLTGGDSNDKLRGGLGTDTMDGGNGVDLVEYTDRTRAAFNATRALRKLMHVSASLDNVANDGYAGEYDSILNVENLLGGQGNDTLTGNSVGNLLAGADGADQLFGLGGNDTLFAYRETVTNDAVADTLNGGDGTDSAVSDTLDSLLNIP